MIALVQRVLKAHVEVNEEIVGAIDEGLLALVCAERGDLVEDCDALVTKVLRLRLFADAAGKMNLSLTQVGGALLAVPQFTLAADTHSGARPSFTPAAKPDLATILFERFVAGALEQSIPVRTGRFGAHMRVSLVNDGPVTFWLRVPPSGPLE